MNQILKSTVYGKGTKQQIEFIADLGGMNEEETELFKLLHEGKPDDFIQDKMQITRQTYSRIEESVRAKLVIAIFTCINKTYDLMNN